MPSSASHLRYAGCRCRTERVVHRGRTHARRCQPTRRRPPGWGGHSRSTGHAAPAGRMDGGVLAEGRRAGSERDWAAASRRRQAAERARTTNDPTSRSSPTARGFTTPDPTSAVRPTPQSLHPDPLPALRVASTAPPWLPDLLPRQPSSGALEPDCRRPASRPAPCFPPGLANPDFPGRSRKGSPARSGGLPFLQSPGGKPRKHPEAGRRPVALRAETHRAKQMERNTRRETGRAPDRPSARSRPYIADSSAATSSSAVTWPAPSSPSSSRPTLR
jgi:hypothetical protein